MFMFLKEESLSFRDTIKNVWMKQYNVWDLLWNNVGSGGVAGDIDETKWIMS